MTSRTGSTSDQDHRLLRYVYGELNEAEAADYERRLFAPTPEAENERESFYDYIDLKKRLEEAISEPRERTTRRIMAFARSANAEPLAELPRSE